MRMATALGTPGLSPALWGQGLVSIGHPSQLCFAHKQVVGIIVESAALRDGPPLDVNQGQGEERRRGRRKGRQERREQGGWSAADGISISWKYGRRLFDMMILHDAGIDQGGFGAADGASPQLTLLREAAGFGMIILQDAGGDQGGWSVADCPHMTQI